MLMGRKKSDSSVTAMIQPCSLLSTPARIEKMVCEKM
jgi:hypothetical protein